MELQQAQRQLAAELSPPYDPREAGLIADWVMEYLTGLKRIDRLVHASDPLSTPVLERFENYRDQLLANRPVQYVLNESWFAGLKFYVDENVLIPRPETEELVEWTARAITTATTATDAPSPTSTGAPAPVTPGAALLDVGTGSGCIAIALAKQLPSLPIHACDISSEALGIAQRNATQLNANIQFHQLDFLDSRQRTHLPPVRWLISNPPYIPLNERKTMAPHVIGAEPSLALFVPDADPLVFYKALIGFARQKLLPEGSIFVEIHEDRASDTVALFKEAGFQQVILRKDMQGRDRMIKASLSQYSI